MKITFDRYSKFINDLYLLINENKIKILEITIGKNAKFYDLYSFGRFLGTLKHLTTNEKIKVTVSTHKWSVKRIQFYNDLGIWDLLKIYLAEDLITELKKTNAKPSINNLIPIVKLQRIEIPSRIEDSELINIESNKIIEQLLHQSVDSINSHFENRLSIINVLIPYLNHFFFTIVTELLSNIFKHSESSEIYFGLTLFRENLIQGDPRRKGSIHIAGSYALDFLIYDSGKGIFQSFKDHFEHQNISNKDILDYYKFTAFSPSKYKPIYSYLKVTESNILSNLFSGNLSIRKGRRSDGLFDVSEKLSWHNGIINFFSGRTEVTLRHVNNLKYKSIETNDFIKDKKTKSHPPLIKGVLISGLLPIFHLSSWHLQSTEGLKFLPFNEKPSQLNTESDEIINKYIWHKLKPLDKQFFTNRSKEKIEFFSNLTIKTINDKYVELSTNNPSKIIFIEVDLKRSRNINIPFIDNFIQVLLKTQYKALVNRIVFTNVPRRVILQLKDSNCSSFLKIHSAICLFYDELDFPYFLGLSKYFNYLNGIPEAIYTLLKRGNIETLKIRNENATEIREILKTIIDNNQNDILYRDSDFFFAHPIQKLIYTERLKHIRHIYNYLIGFNQINKTYKLINGKKVSHIIDLQTFWNNQQRLNDCVNLLLRKDILTNKASDSFFPLSNSIITFSRNGLLIAKTIRDRFNINEILIVEDDSIQNDLLYERINLQHSIRPIIVLDILYAGDWNKNSFLNRLLVKLKNESKTFSIVTFFNYSTKQAIDNVKIHSLFDLKHELSIKSYKIFKEIHPKAAKISSKNKIPIDLSKQHSLNRTTPILIRDRNDNYDSETPSKTKSEYYTSTNSLKNKVDNSYSRIETSLTFWQNVSELGLVTKDNNHLDKRTNYFNEDVGKLFQIKRIRRFITDYVVSTIKDYNFTVDVIILPDHMGGNYLANLFTNNLENRPLVFKMRQSQYGGSIEISEDEYEYFRVYINERIVKYNITRKLNCLILDDSIFTGKSIFTLIGISRKLNLIPKSVFVLFNRLSKEISETINFSVDYFSYIYRLHMSVINSKYQSIHSYFSVLIDQGNNDSIFSQNISPSGLILNNNNFPLKITDDELNEIGKSSNLLFRHVIEDIILNPSYNNINIETRIIASYNFIEILFIKETQLFISFLKNLLVNYKLSDNSNLFYVQRITAIISSLKHHFRVNQVELFEKFISESIEFLLKSDWDKNEELANTLSALILISGHIQSNFFNEDTLPKNLTSVLDKANIFNITNSNVMKILGCFSISISHFEQDQLDVKKIIPINNFTTGLIISDLLRNHEPTSNHNKASLFNDIKLISFLKTAPGYNYTLSIILQIFNADCVFLFGKNKSETGNKSGTEWNIWEYSTNNEFDNDANFSYDDIHTFKYSDRTTFDSKEFKNSNSELLKILNKLLPTGKYKFAIGLPLLSKRITMDYFILVGSKLDYSNLTNQKVSLLNSKSILLWQDYKPFLENILETLETKYKNNITNNRAIYRAIRIAHIPDINQ